jgi:ABC-type multidrug transport system fused ATPase/permease subunit
MSQEENERTAIGIGITLSGQLITATLALLAVAGTFVVYIIDKWRVGIVFYVLIILTLLSSVTSMIYGGKGINLAREKGHAGDWGLKLTKKQFNRQALFGILSIIFFLVSIFCGHPKTDDTEASQAALKTRIEHLELQDSTERSALQQQQADIRSLRRKVDSILTTRKKCLKP